MPLSIISIFVVCILFFLVGYYFYHVAFFPKIFPVAETLKMELENERLINYPQMETWDREEIHIHSPFGYDLFGYFYPLKNAQKTVILSHGIRISLYGSLKYIPIFRTHGFNVLVYDNRFHGRSGGKACTFGFYEKYDLRAVVDWVVERFGPAALIGTHGESLGAAITLQHAAIDPRIAFAISDCSFSNLDRLFRFRLRKDYHLPASPLLNVCGWYAKRQLGFDYKDASPIKRIGQIETPILFIHGDQDTYIPPSMSVDLYNLKTSGVRAIYQASGAKHAEALVKDRVSYQNHVDQFLISIGLLDIKTEVGTPV